MITDRQISAYLDRRGIKYAGIGRHSLMEAIRYRLENPGYYKITALYNLIGKKMGISLNCVERSIRTAIMASRDFAADGSPTNNYYADGSFVTSKEFIERAVSDLKFEYEGE